MTAANRVGSTGTGTVPGAVGPADGPVPAEGSDTCAGYRLHLGTAGTPTGTRTGRRTVTQITTRWAESPVAKELRRRLSKSGNIGELSWAFR
ncbi:hypothetical protein GCM10009779_42080 [Polymorphospora rubra]|uniref:Uncharacterized protein n=1 Tax=Polymorphospora rubra TaxID=338584 RepID=A0A810MVR6_9ACTN|nr:hypothetical protein Prubr_16650 [Polymorphospora rubra]